jgi:[protein-PII] uridylyltransferase
MSKSVEKHQDLTELFDAEQFSHHLAETDKPVILFREAIQNASTILDERYRQNKNILDIVTGRAWLIDQILRFAWNSVQWAHETNISLVAVGGYGRGELHPYSDIDLLILTRRSRNAKYAGSITQFLTLLWDIGLEIGHSVRSVRQCKVEAIKDITVATALMESRVLVGPADLQTAMLKATNSRSVWPIKKFLRAKWDEQIERHNKDYDIDYALEPNVKTSPGGLRDIQTIAWVTNRHFGAKSFHDLVELDFITLAEEITIDEGQQFLWKLRYGLHLLAGHREDRLLFDKQCELASLFGYLDDEKSLGVEKLMQKYYRTVSSLRELNDVLLQHLDEAILRAREREKIVQVNDRLQIRNGYIQVSNSSIFKRYPHVLLEIFVLMGQNPDIQGIRASTIRLLRENLHLIDNAFRKDPKNTSLFMELIRAPHQLATRLRRMSRYGILGRYLPEFGQITGKMQHDMFHIYTVDAHTLQVIENMRRFRRPDAKTKFPVAAHIVHNLSKLELLYIAGLYHDIAKGRGGDHSTLGMTDAEHFCQRHELSKWDAKLVCWLVNKHLFMSMTAQRKDIDDPEVIHEFAEVVGDKLHLDYLYAMTVADICATNPNLWTSWRATLLRQLYLNTKRALRLGLEKPRNREDRVTDKQLSAMQKLLDKGLSKEQINAIWKNTANEYFLRESASNIVWHTEAIAGFNNKDPLISIHGRGEHSAEGATQIFIYTRNGDFLFANTTAGFEKLKLNIQSARIFTSANDYCIDTYTVLEGNGKPVGNDPERIAQIKSILSQYLRNNKVISPAKWRKQRKQKSFSQHVDTTLLNAEDKAYSTVEINCPDQPGILACVGKVFADNQINVKDARITTLGERVEDLFFVTNHADKPITNQQEILALQAELKKQLEERIAN